MEVGGEWRAAVADDELRRRFADADFDDGAWESVTVPGHWRSNAAFHDCDGPLLYRTAFEHESGGAGERTWITFDGVFYQGDVWLDGAYLGDTEGYFLPHTFEVTEQLAARHEHHLSVEVACPPQTEKRGKRNLTGAFQGWEGTDAGWNPGGIWRPVRLETTGPVRIRDLRLLCRAASASRATVVLRANLLSDVAHTVIVRSTIGAVGHELEQAVAAGENHVEWTVTIDDPQLWWPWALGEQPMHDVAVEVWVSGEQSHRRTVQTGLRSVSLDRWICSVNGERLFLKGANHGPTRMAIADATAEEVARDVELAKSAGLDLLRVHSHVARPELYEAADRAGVLLWQDLPLRWSYAPGVRKQAVRQANAAVRVLGHHPSIAVWCGHDDPAGSDGTLANQLPTWNRTILDRSIKRALERADGTRPVVAHSGVVPHPPQLDGTDSHLYFGWHRGDAGDLPRFAARFPRMVRFVTEFGAQAVPDDAAFCEPGRWPDLDWDRLARVHGFQRDRFEEHAPPSDFSSFDEWRAASQRYQAELIKQHVETLRRLKYAPTGGFAQFCLADAAPAVGWSVLDHARGPKLGYAALAAACRAVIVVADWLPAQVRAGGELDLDVHVVSDLREELSASRVSARLSWTGGERAWKWEGTVEADACVRVGTIEATVPATPGPLVLELSLDGPANATNRYESEIVDRPL